MSVMLYPCMLCVALLMCLFVLCVCELFGETIRNVCGCSSLSRSPHHRSKMAGFLIIDR